MKDSKKERKEKEWYVRKVVDAFIYGVGWRITYFECIYVCVYVFITL